MPRSEIQHLPASQSDDGPVALPPAVEFRLGIVIRFRRLPRWLLAVLAGLAGASTSYWHLH